MVSTVAEKQRRMVIHAQMVHEMAGVRVDATEVDCSFVLHTPRHQIHLDSSIANERMPRIRSFLRVVHVQEVLHVSQEQTVLLQAVDWTAEDEE